MDTYKRAMDAVRHTTDLKYALENVNKCLKALDELGADIAITEVISNARVLSLSRALRMPPQVKVEVYLDMMQADETTQPADPYASVSGEAYPVAQPVRPGPSLPNDEEVPF
jgi:hypothetical protein